MIKRVISLIVLILLNSSCLTLCVEPEQTPTETPTTQTTTATTTTTQIQRDKQTFEKLLTEFREIDQQLKTNNKTLSNLNSKTLPVITGILTAGVTGGICYLLKYTRPKIALWSGVFGLTSMVGAKILQWFGRKIKPSNELKGNNIKLIRKRKKRQGNLLACFPKFCDTPTYINNILSIEKNNRLRRILLAMLP